ncbi:MAG: hypothetical protein EBU62_09285 [Proteobacteria bacterium]|nr:hypothetical protein [Pseudomonadota bacterium]NCV23574.1 hypothetical protein [Chloroflexota bacterium]
MAAPPTLRVRTHQVDAIASSWCVRVFTGTSDGVTSSAGYSARGHAIRPRGLVPMMASRSAGECADVRKK